MNRFQSQILYGLLITITGVLLILLSKDLSRIIQYAVAAGMLLSSFFAFVTADKSKGSETPFKFNWLLGLGMVVYALAILMYGSAFDRFITVIMAFLLYFGIVEIIFGFSLMAYKKSISLQLIVFRMIIGLLMTIGAVLIFGLAVVDKNASLLFAGALIFLSGANFIVLENTPVLRSFWQCFKRKIHESYYSTIKRRFFLFCLQIQQGRYQTRNIFHNNI